jgi:methylmalonyl-CoA mutase N-terminal domain/subunit
MPAMTKERKPLFRTHSGIELKRIYTHEDLEDFDPASDLGEAGEYPFTRGIYPSMYRGRLWTMRQYAGFGTAKESNRRYRYLLQQGQTGLSVAFDLPTQLGLDSDDPRSQGEVGRVGVAIDTLDDMRILFAGIPLDRVSVSMTINATAAVILAMYLALAQDRNISWKRLAGTIQNDILKEYVARGTYIFPPEASLKITTHILEFCRRHVPAWNTMSISGYHIREAGATAVQELAFTFANAKAYLETFIKAGLDIDTFAPRLSFFLAAHNNFLEEVAKFRAARRIWAKMVRTAFHARDPNSWKFRFHTQTSGMTLVAQEPDNNVVRVTLQALSAVMGGTQSLHTNSRDEALTLPSQDSARIALRTQQILAQESGVADAVDPLGGSYCIEGLTSRIENEVNAYLRKIDEMGGVLKAIEQGYIQREIQASAYSYQREIESQERIIVGLNAFTSREERMRFELYVPPPLVHQNQLKNLRRAKQKRNATLVANGLNALRHALTGEKNLMPGMIEAVKAGATLGEVSGVLQAAFGTYTENVTV